MNFFTNLTEETSTEETTLPHAESLKRPDVTEGDQIWLEF